MRALGSSLATIVCSSLSTHRRKLIAHRVDSADHVSQRVLHLRPLRVEPGILRASINNLAQDFEIGDDLRMRMIRIRAVDESHGVKRSGLANFN
jgi:hypothetical protein